MILAGIVVILGGIAAARDVVIPVFIALYFSLVCTPVYVWLQRKRVPNALALLIIAAGVVLVGGGLVVVAATSLGRASANVARSVMTVLQQASAPDGALTVLGIGPVDVNELVRSINPSSLTGIAGRVLGTATDVLSTLLVILVVMAFLLLDGPRVWARAQAALGEDHALYRRLSEYGPTVVRYFSARTLVNLVTGAAVGILLLILGVDFALLWAVLAFFLSYIPFVGLALSIAPPALLALAESGLGRAAAVIIGVVLINLAIENVVDPAVTGKQMQLSPTAVFISFLFWTFLLGPLATLVAMPLTLLLMVVLDSFEETRWLARMIGQPAGAA